MDVNRPMRGPSCALVAELVDEPLAGTSATARSWLAIEQPGPWGRDGLSASHLDDGVAGELARLSAGTGVRIVLIRRPGSHPDRHRPVPRTVYLAHTAPGRTWLERTSVTEPKELLDLDFARAGDGEPGLLGTAVTERVLLVCTNGRRDVCCAVRGRPIAAALAPVFGEQVWECTHIGGHRFAPTGVLLPTGYSYGRLTTESATRLLAGDGSGGVTETACRGRSTWPAQGQVAELAVRARSGVLDPDAFTVTGMVPHDDGWLVDVTQTDGRVWQVAVRQQQLADERPASCGKAPTPAVTLRAVSVVARRRRTFG